MQTTSEAQEKGTFRELYFVNQILAIENDQSISGYRGIPKLLKNAMFNRMVKLDDLMSGRTFGLHHSVRCQTLFYFAAYL